MNHNKHSSEGLQKQLNLKNLSTEELKHLLIKVEHQHDVLQATNEELTIQISDLRNAVKCVESEGRENVAFELEKKKKLENKIESLEKGLKYSTKNHLFNATESFKALQQ